MALNLNDTIEAIRQKPEHVRMRYAIGLALICMVFVTIIWLLTVRQGFSDSSPETKERVNEVTNTFRDAGSDMKPGVDSLKDLAPGTNIRVDEGGKKTEEFVNEEVEKGMKPVLGIPAFSE
jgi:hypothetical protein